MAGGDFEDDALGGAPLSTGSSDLDLIDNVGDQSVGKHMLLMVPGLLQRGGGRHSAWTPSSGRSRR